MAIIFFTFVVGLILLGPAFLLLSWLAAPIFDVSVFDMIREGQFLFCCTAIITLIAAPVTSSFIKAKQNVKPKQAIRKAEEKPVKKTAEARPQDKASQQPKKTIQPPKEILKQEDPGTDDVPEADTDAISFQPAVNVTTTFADIAGYEHTKENMEFIVKCLREPDMLRQVGAKIPAGILLYGPPGTGKTLMAKAIAGTAGVNFYSANASEFVNTWVGQGAKNVRSLYRTAKENTPSIVFIDEIDAIGGQRTAGQNQEYRQTLNALLTEIDGMDKDSGVLTIAATNDFENLDLALVRPGRFDRKIIVPLPSVSDRLAIIKLYASKRNMASDISLEKLARETVGMSGSSLSTLFNEASIRAVMNNRGVVSQSDLDEAMTQMLTNGEAVKASNQEDLRIAAYHEAGHAVILKLLAHDNVPKVSIIGSTIGAVGITFHMGSEDRRMIPIEQIRARIIASYGGRAAEELIFGKDHITTGASQDIKDASVYIREYLECGAGSSLLHETAFAGSHVTPDYREAKALSTVLYREAVDFLSEHRPALERVAQALMDRETILEDELEKYLF